jgi:hypothetical protein
MRRSFGYAHLPKGELMTSSRTFERFELREPNALTPGRIWDAVYEGDSIEVSFSHSETSGAPPPGATRTVGEREFTGQIVARAARAAAWRAFDEGDSIAHVTKEDLYRAIGALE